MNERASSVSTCERTWNFMHFQMLLHVNFLFPKLRIYLTCLFKNLLWFLKNAVWFFYLFDSKGYNRSITDVTKNEMRRQEILNNRPQQPPQQPFTSQYDSYSSNSINFQRQDTQRTLFWAKTLQDMKPKVKTFFEMFFLFSFAFFFFSICLFFKLLIIYI